MGVAFDALFSGAARLFLRYRKHGENNCRGRINPFENDK